MTKQLAIIKGVGFGCRDTNRAVLWFTTYVSENAAALQVFDIEQAKGIIEKYGVYDIRDLEGKPCWVEADHATIKFLEPMVLP